MRRIPEAVFAVVFLAAPIECLAGSEIVQSLYVDFPKNGRVIVQAREEVGRFPRLLLISVQTGKVLLQYVFTDEYGWLKPEAGDESAQRPFLRFRIIRTAGIPGPVVLAVAVRPGGSDHAFYCNAVAEDGIRLRTLSKKPLFINIQGGVYIGPLHKSLGYGLVTWTFLWNEGSHYDYHHYEIYLYTIRAGWFNGCRRYVSHRVYVENGIGALRELGIKAHDQHPGIPKVRDYLE